MKKYLKGFLLFILIDSFFFTSCIDEVPQIEVQLKYEFENIRINLTPTKQSVIFSPDSKSLIIFEDTLKYFEIDTGLITNYRLAIGTGAISFSNKTNRLFLASIASNPISNAINTDRILLTEFNKNTGTKINNYFVGKFLSKENYHRILKFSIPNEIFRTKILSYGFLQKSKYLWTFSTIYFDHLQNGEFRSVYFLAEKSLITIWDISNQIKTMELQLDDNVSKFSISNDMSKIFYTTKNRFFKTEYLVLFDLQKNVELKRIDNTEISESWNIKSMSFSPDNNFIAIACTDDKIRILNFSTNIGNIVSVLKNYSVVSSLYYSSDGKYLFSGNKNGDIVAYDTENNLEILNYKTDSSEIIKIDISTNNNYLFTIDIKGKLNIYSLFWE